MATVFEAEHMLLQRRAAVKVMHAALRGNHSMDSRMVQEARILDELSHPGIVRVFDCDVLPDGRPWIAMELVDGESLAAKLARDATLSATEVCNLLAAVADVLVTVHPRGIVHRDLEPDNILFADADTGFPLRVIDWGVEHLALDARLTLDDVTCGTPFYMSPEQAIGRDIAPPCDIYSLGVVAYEAIAGVAPFEGRTLADVVASQHGGAASLAKRCPAMPRARCELVHRMLDKSPRARPSATDVRCEAQRIALQIVENSASGTVASAEAMSSPPASAANDDAPAHAGAVAPARWTPEMSMVDGSGYLFVRPQGGWSMASDDHEPKR